ncbi:Uncharacterised protein [Salmonella enterica subsp. enterica]|nr:Uncharacterised protein [Salmonella enterica subsp. enterica]
MCYRLFNIRQRLHDAVNLAQFNTLPPNFELIVAAPQVLHRAGIQPARHISGTVHPFAWRKRIGDKTAGGKIRTPQIALRQLDTGKIEIASHARRHRLHMRIENT